MITIKIKFKYEGWCRTLTAILNNKWELTKHKHNQAFYVNEDFGDEERWSLEFDVDGQIFEAVMCRDEEGNKLPSVDYVIAWAKDHDCIDEDLDATSTVKYS